MLHIHLPDDEVHSLEATFRTMADCRLRDRLQLRVIALRGLPVARSSPTSASATAPSHAGSTPTSTAVSTACCPVKSRGPPLKSRPVGRRDPAVLADVASPGDTIVCSIRWPT